MPTDGQPVPLRDVIDIPERISASDFVLQLHEGVSAAERTLGDYVVTDSIAKSFGEALGLVNTAIDRRVPKGAFVHGSFGSGKSHFMAVLHLLLTGNTTARALPKLQKVIAANTALLNKKFLAVDYHLLGKTSFEGALFAGYLDEVARRHPDARPPVLHRSDALFADAIKMRQNLGDEPFFDSLNEGNRADTAQGWGEGATTWNASLFEASIAEPVGGGGRTELAQALISTFFGGYTKTGEWLEISEGLKVMTQHTRDLGYDGLVLFLDELVLWLGQHLGDSNFIATETSKVAKLVETEMSSLPVPIVSFVARQRDLKDFLGGGTVGAEQVALGQSFQWWEDRFDPIFLSSSDLPKIVQQRLLKPKDDAAAALIGAALAKVKGNLGAWGYLLTDEVGSGEVDFAAVYPFSPALVDALVALSSLLQRERTALKILGELLVQGRDELTLSDVVPVGDLFDVVVLGTSKPLTQDMTRRFETAATFYREKMRPHLLAKHQLTEAAAASLPRTAAFRTEDRLAKTLLVAEIAPGAVSLKNLTASKLAALNFGSVRSMVPGQEATQVLGLVDQWSREFGEITKGAGVDPIITLTLAGVDYDSVIERVQNIDQPDARRSLIRDMLISELGLPSQAGLITERVLSHVWRGSKREVDVVFGNVRDPKSLGDEALRANPGRWKVVVDYPFDEAGHSPSDDFARLESLTSQGVQSDTVAWIPHFFTATRMDSVGRLVLLEYVLNRDRFDQNASHLPVNDREHAKQALENQRRSLREQVSDALRQAYAIASPNPADVEVHVQGKRVFDTLRPGLAIAPPVASSLRAGLEDALGQALAYQYPDHPEFEPAGTEVRRAELTTVLALMQDAVAAGGRLDGIEKPKAALLRRVAGPLGIGIPRENVYALGQDSFSRWGDFTQWAATSAASTDQVKVGDLRARLAPIGLVRDLQDLLILAWSLLDDREWVRYGVATAAPSVGAVSDDFTLRLPHLPEQEAWTSAVERSEQLFGVAREHRLSVSALARLAAGVRSAITRFTEPSGRLVASLTAHADVLGIDPEALTGRLGTARVARSLAETLAAEKDDSTLIEVLALADLPDEPQALARSLSMAHEVASKLAGVQWDTLASARSLGEGRGAQILADLAKVAAKEELHAPLIPALEIASREAHQLVLAAARIHVPTPPPTPDVVAPAPGPTVPTPDPTAPVNTTEPVVHVDDVQLVISDVADLRARLSSVESEIRAALTEAPGKNVRITWRLE
jgi:hypothetical protein